MIGVIILAAFAFIVIAGGVVAIIDRHDQRKYAEHEQRMSEIAEELDEPPHPDARD